MAVGTTGVPVVALTVGMAAVCLFCARELWADGSLRSWCVVALMNVAMLAAHSSLPAHHHAESLGVQSRVGIASEPPSALMTIATTVAVIEIALAVVVLMYRTRGRAAQLASGRSELA